MQQNTLSRSAHWVALAAAAVLGALGSDALAAPPASDGIVVATVQGDVRVTVAGKAQAARAGAVLSGPATIRTGRDGVIELRQGRTRASVAADTHLEIPASSRGGLLERVVQSRGNVFYDVAPRSGSKLRVETPYLVAVIKGTQFNVAASDDSATVSLFEGRLEIWTPDDSDVVQLNQGEIATRGRGDRRIRVLTMSTGEALRASTDAQRDDAARTASDGTGTEPRTAMVEPTERLDPLSGRLIDGGAAGELPPASLSGEIGSGKLNVGVGSAIDAGGGTIATGLTAGVDLGSSQVGAGVGASVDLGAGSVDVGASLDTSAGGVVGAGVGASAAVDLGSGSVDLGAGASVDLGGATLADAGVSAGVDASTGSVDLGASATVLQTPVTVDTGVDLSGGAPAVDLGLAAGPVTVDLGVDLGAPAPTPAPEPTVVEQVVAPVVRGLLGR